MKIPMSVIDLIKELLECTMEDELYVNIDGNVYHVSGVDTDGEIRLTID